jgi:acetyl-CoA C-acetyltransferase
MENVVIVAGVRTPIGSYGGTLRDVPVYRLASVALNEVVKRVHAVVEEDKASVPSLK